MNPDSYDHSEADPEQPARRLPAPFHPDNDDSEPKSKPMSIFMPDPDYEDEDDSDFVTREEPDAQLGADDAGDFGDN